MTLSVLDPFYELMSCSTITDWSNRLFEEGRRYGFGQLMFAVVCKDVPLESSFQQSNYSVEWIEKYKKNKFYYIDPIVAHCVGHFVPLVWDDSTFKYSRQKMFYDEGVTYGMQQGIGYPIHGKHEEVGWFNCVADGFTSKTFQKELNVLLPKLALLRDYACESSQKFICPVNVNVNLKVSQREIECLSWAAGGKSSSEIADILNCSEATVNFHFANIRKKMNVSNRQQAIVRAIRLGLIFPD